MPTSSAQLVPALTALDERVLRALDPPAATADVVRRLYPVSTRSAGASPEQAQEVLEVLRGLQCVGRARERAGLWHPQTSTRQPRR